jgi:hypothetical protein
MLDVELTLLLLKAWILFVDHVQAAFPPHDLAICAAFFDRSSYLHFVCFLSLLIANSINLLALNYLYRKMILPLVRS